jgi:hypothetical protein
MLPKAGTYTGGLPDPSGADYPKARCSLFSGVLPSGRGRSPRFRSPEAGCWRVLGATGVVQAAVGVSSDVSGGVESGDELAVGVTRGGEFLITFIELQPQVDDLLFE